MHREDGEFSIRINNAREFEFSADIYDYRITVDHTVAALDIEADYPAGASVIISDTVIPESDRLSVSVIYIDPDGNSYNYYIDVTREEEYIADGNAYLSFLKVDGFELSPAFDKLINEYTLSVPYDTVQITLKYEPESEYCLAELQNPELLVGENIVKITCIAENGDINEYIITVTREAAAESEDSSEISETPVDKDFPNYIIYIALPVLAGGASAFVIIRKRRKQQA
jgi:hypothetical protein